METMAGETTPPIPLAPVRRPPGGPVRELRATGVVCHRELLRWVKDGRRLVAGLTQPLLWLFVLGSGLSGLVSSADVVGGGAVDFRTFLFPGVLANSVMATSVFSGVSVVWDREFGFLREMLVAPVSRTSILAGKCLGGAIVATAQAGVILALAGFAGVPYSPLLMIQLLFLAFLTALVVTSFGLLLGAKVSNIQSVFPIIQTIVTPMMFLSGALYPTAGLPTWLAVATRLNPVSYAVHPMRSTVFSHLDLPASTLARLDTPLTWFGWPVPNGLQLVVLGVLGLTMFAVANRRFGQAE